MVANFTCQAFLFAFFFSLGCLLQAQSDLFDEGVYIDDAVGPVLLFASGDVDNDGLVDLFVADQGQFSIARYSYEGDGVIGNRIELDSETGFLNALKLVDFDHDGDEDLLYCGFMESGWYENVNGSFSTAQVLEEIDAAISKFQFADFNGDDLADLIGMKNDDLYIQYASANGLQEAVLIEESEDPAVLFFDTGDLDNDGRLDIAAKRAGNSGTFLMRNTDSGAFTTTTLPFEESWSPNILKLDDFNGDGLTDVLLITPVVVNQPSKIFWKANLGNMTFSEEKLIHDGFWSHTSVQSSDFDANGTTDIFTLSGSEGYGNLHTFLENELYANELVLSFPCADEGHAASLSLDADIDIVACVNGALLFFENQLEESASPTGLESENVNDLFRFEHHQIQNLSNQKLRFRLIDLQGRIVELGELAGFETLKLKTNAFKSDYLAIYLLQIEEVGSGKVYRVKFTP